MPTTFPLAVSPMRYNHFLSRLTNPITLLSNTLSLEFDTINLTLSGSDIEYINDLSGNGNHFDQTAGAAKPLHLNGDTGRFDGVAEFLECINGSTPFESDTQGEMIIVSARTNKATKSGVCFSLGNISVATDYLTIEHTAVSNVDYLRILNDGASATDHVSYIASDPDNSFMIKDYSSNASRYRININNVDLPITVDTGADTGDWMSDMASPSVTYIGKYARSTSVFTEGDIKAIYYFNTELTTVERAGVMAYINNKYSVYTPIETFADVLSEIPNLKYFGRFDSLVDNTDNDYGIVNASGDIGTVKDLAGTAENWVQATPSAKPDNSGTSADFDGVAEYMSNPDLFTEISGDTQGQWIIDFDDDSGAQSIPIGFSDGTLTHYHGFGITGPNALNLFSSTGNVVFEDIVNIGGLVKMSSSSSGTSFKTFEGFEERAYISGSNNGEWQGDNGSLTILEIGRIGTTLSQFGLKKLAYSSTQLSNEVFRQFRKYLNNL